jgi:hypothetical protein
MTAIAYGGCGINSLRAGYCGLNGGLRAILGCAWGTPLGYMGYTATVASPGL